MVAIPHDKTNYHKMSKLANVLIFKEFYPKSKNMSFYLKELVASLYVLRPNMLQKVAQ